MRAQSVLEPQTALRLRRVPAGIASVPPAVCLAERLSDQTTEEARPTGREKGLRMSESARHEKQGRPAEIPASRALDSPTAALSRDTLSAVPESRDRTGSHLLP